MRKTIAVLAIAICVSLCAVSLAQADSRTAEPGSPAARSDARDTITIHRLLRDRIEFTLRLARSMNLLEPPAPTEEPVYTNGIIDEPDPAGNWFKRDEEDDERERQRRRREQETMNTDANGGSPIQMTFRD